MYIEITYKHLYTQKFDQIVKTIIVEEKNYIKAQKQKIIKKIGKKVWENF
jgi:hypothetical protein